MGVLSTDKVDFAFVLSLFDYKIFSFRTIAILAYGIHNGNRNYKWRGSRDYEWKGSSDMKEICLIYYDTGVGLSNYVILYFRMIGIFVHEDVICDEWVSVNDFDSEGVGVDAEIIVWNSEMQHMDWQDDRDEYSFLLYEENTYWEVMESFDDSNTMLIEYSSDDQYIAVIKDLLRMMAKIFRKIAIDYSILEKLADIFEENRVFDAFMGSRFCIPNKEIFEQCCGMYEDAFDEIERQELELEEEDYHAVFAMIYLAYECNYALKQLDSPFLFDVDSMIENLDEIEEKKWPSLDLLYAQIYDDLLGKKERAKTYYVKIIERYENSFAWYKLGMIYETVDKKYNAAYHCMKRALWLDPVYFKALRHAGDCQMFLGDVAEAKKYYEATLQRLRFRKDQMVMRVIEAEYYYKTCNALGMHEQTRSGNNYLALMLYQSAEGLWLECKAEKGKNLAVLY